MRYKCTDYSIYQILAQNPLDMRLPQWLSYIALGPLTMMPLLLGVLGVRADMGQISAKDLEMFTDLHQDSLQELQGAMLGVIRLWDQGLDQKQQPLTLDVLARSLNTEKKNIAQIIRENSRPRQVVSILKSYGFKDTPIPIYNTLNFKDFPNWRVYFWISTFQERAGFARGFFRAFRNWAENNIGITRWNYGFNPSQHLSTALEYEVTAPLLFGGGYFGDEFYYHFSKRQADFEQFEKYISALSDELEDMEQIYNNTFQRGPKVLLGADVKMLFEQMMEIVKNWRDGIQVAFKAYVAIPTLPGVEDDPASQPLPEVPETRPMMAKPQTGTSEAQEQSSVDQLGLHNEPVAEETTRDLQKDAENMAPIMVTGFGINGLPEFLGVNGGPGEQDLSFPEADYLSPNDVSINFAIKRKAAKKNKCAAPGCEIF
ncbi:hypothetical protein ABW19_dt0203167 [Dactylella cylindrospora]|nr:hypothetical protein ABW19_dt0203167 [Dactylella cylindrospora]